MSLIKNKSFLKAQLLKGSVWAFSGKLLRMISGLIVNALLARLLSPDEVGAYFLTFSVITFWSILAQFGMKTTVVRLVSESMSKELPGRALGAIRYAFIFSTLTAILISVLYYSFLGEYIAISAFNSTLMAGVISISSIWIIVFTLQSIFSEVFRGFHSIGFASLFDGLITSVLMAIFFSVAYMKYGSLSLFNVVNISVIAWLLANVLASVFLRRVITLLSNTGLIKAKEIFDIAWPQLITAISFFIVSQSALLIVGMFLLDSDAAIYGSALRLVTLVSIPLLVLNAVVPPHIAGMYAKGEIHKMERMLRATASVAGVPSALLLIIFVIYGEQLLGIMYGEFYKEGALILGILSCGQLVNVWAGSCGNVLMMTGNQKIMMNISVVSSVIAIIGSLVLVQPYGITGVAVITSVALIIQNIWMLICVKKRVGVYTHLTINAKQLMLYIK